MKTPALPTLKLYFTPLHYVLQSPDTGSEAQLILERTTGRIYCTENFNPLENGSKESELYYLDVFSILGIIVLDSTLYLCVITDADIIGTLAKANIYEIKGIKLLPYVHNPSEQEQETIEKENLTKLFTTGFYFSYYYDLTRSMQRSKADSNLHNRADKSFYWNLELYSDLIVQSVDTQWLIPVIQGFISIDETSIDGHEATLGLISRRSCDRTGTRYNCRGVDDEGNVANFVETEQILVYGNKIYSHVQIRGSVPIYWEQTGITAQLSLTKSQELSSVAFKHHISKMIHKYLHLTMINLLHGSKAHEKLLTQEFENVFKLSRHHFNGKLVYQYFDFHHNCKSGRYQSIIDLIKGLKEYFNCYKFYSQSSTRVECTQKGVMRTNCLDCLDRTNVVQCYIGWTVLSQILAFSPNFESVDQPIVQIFKNQWADNGDMLSLQYTGTSSTISSITRGEKQGIKTILSQSFKSINRFYNANLNDAAKQKSIDAVLRRRKDLSQTNWIEAEINSRESDYTRFYQHRLKCATWNLAGEKFLDSSQIIKVLGNKDQFDILFFSVQELVKLNANNILREKNNEKRLGRLKLHLGSLLGDEFLLVCSDSLVGLALLVYCRQAIFSLVSQVNTDQMRLGLGGKTGNKGAVVARFNIQSTSVCVVAGHLASGLNNSDLRKSQIRDVQADIFVKQRPDRRQMQIFEHDYKFFLGDLNFRIDLPSTEIHALINRQQFELLLKSDQLTQALSEGSLPGYQEGNIDFPPTYKFHKQNNTYNSSRLPAWCDRILFSGNPEILNYYSVETRGSDHKPVVANFFIKSKETDYLKIQKLRDELFGEIEECDLILK